MAVSSPSEQVSSTQHDPSPGGGDDGAAGVPADGPDPQVVAALRQACVDFGADAVERMALFCAALVATNLRACCVDDQRLGPLAQPSTWGPAPARRDPYTAATVFLREARRVRGGPRAPRGAAGLAARVQGRPGAWRHARVRRRAEQVLAGQDSTEEAAAGRTPAVPVPAEA